MVIRSPPFYNTIQCIVSKVLLKEVEKLWQMDVQKQIKRYYE